ncbi:MAG: fibrillarin-like rRNA/tRNA 2'-O-methyltransferase [Candidatus Aenigmatarchaeota archaeon]
MKVKQSKFEGIFFINNKIATLNTVPGYKPFNEEVVKISEKEYRIWDPYTSKPAAAIKNNIKNFPVIKGMKILYLGIASAKTATYLSNIIGSEGLIYGIDISQRVLRDAIPVAERYGNIVCILGDCRKPETYEKIIVDRVDCVYCDIADPQEIEIFIRNCERFLKREGYGMVAVKSRSIDVTKNPRVIYKETTKKLEENGFEIIDFVTLDPYEKDHGFFVVRFK